MSIKLNGHDWVNDISDLRTLTVALTVLNEKLLASDLEESAREEAIMVSTRLKADNLSYSEVVNYLRQAVIDYTYWRKKELKYEMFHFETGEIIWMTMREMLYEINRDRSQTWIPYNISDFREGLETFTEYRLTNKTAIK